MSDSSKEFKIVVAGPTEVGKTAVIKRLTRGTFNEEFQPTIGVEFASYSAQVDGEFRKLQIWDTAGQNRFRSVSKAYFRNARGAILVFDLTQRSSFNELNTWINDLISLCAQNAFIILVGNKSDLINERKITENEARLFANEYNIRYLETSAKTGNNIDEAFQNLIQGIIHPRDETFIQWQNVQETTVENQTNSNRKNKDNQNIDNNEDNDNNDDDYDYNEIEKQHVKRNHNNTIKLDVSSILNVPIENYENNFTFFVNGDEFKTSRLFADLISPKICQIHKTDPALDTFIINTNYAGDFNKIIQLGKFTEEEIETSEFPFISEVFEQLGRSNLEINLANIDDDLTINNAFRKLAEHEKYKEFFAEEISKEIAFIASNFYKVKIEEEEVKNISLEAIMEIIESPKLCLESEDQLLCFVNDLYFRNRNYSVLYENVIFSRVSSEYMSEFIQLFNINDITNETWMHLSMRLKEELENKSNLSEFKRYNKFRKPKTEKNYVCIEGHELDGILSSLHLGSELVITESSKFRDNIAENLVLHELKDKIFYSNSKDLCWVKFDFKMHRVALTDYTIRTPKSWDAQYPHPKSWVVEGSNNDKKYEIISEENNCSYLNGSGILHTFSIKKTTKEFRYIRIRQTGPSWRSNNYCGFESIEFFGKIV